MLIDGDCFNIISASFIHSRNLSFALAIIAVFETFENNSVLKFTYELNTNNQLPFLDVLVDSTSDQFITKVYRKPTDSGTISQKSSG